MKTSKLIGFAGTLTRSRKARMLLVGAELAIMIYAYYKTKKTNENPKIQ